MTEDIVLQCVKVIASISSLYMCCCPLSTAIRMHRSKDTVAMPILPLVALWINNNAWMLYGYVTNDMIPLLVTYAIGSILSIGYLLVYYKYTKARGRLLMLCSFALFFNIAQTFFAVMGSAMLPKSQVIVACGCIANICGLLLYGSPLSTIAKVVKTKDTSSLPVTMVIVGLGNNMIWLVYGILLRDIFLIVPCAANSLLCFSQLIIYLIYRSGRDLKSRALPVTATKPTTVDLREHHMASPRASDLTPAKFTQFESPCDIMTVSTVF